MTKIYKINFTSLHCQRKNEAPMTFADEGPRVTEIILQLAVGLSVIVATALFMGLALSATVVAVEPGDHIFNSV